MNRNELSAVSSIWLIQRQQLSHNDRQIREQLKILAAKMSIDIKAVRVRKLNLVEEGEGSRKINVLQPLDAEQLYREVHEDLTLVIAVGDVRVLTDPTREPATKRSNARLEDFVRHKALYMSAGEAKDFVVRIKQTLTLNPSDCTELNDPRVLPHHIFREPLGPNEIDTVEQRSKYIARYRQNQNWNASHGLWRKASPSGRHGSVDGKQSPLYVWGYELPVGHHWDVQANRSFLRIISASQIWEVRPRGYINIYPNGYIRSGKYSSAKWQSPL